MQFKVPQFLDIEDKIFGPFTFSQFAYLVGGGGIAFVFYKAFGFFLAFIPMALMVSLSLALAFYKPNGKPFIDMLEAGVKYLFQNKLYIWKRKKATKENQNTKKEEKTIHNPRVNNSKLKDLAWGLDVFDKK